MKKEILVYWLSTAFLALSMLASGIGYFTSAETKEAFAHLGFPDYFRVELGIAKMSGAIVLVLPMVPLISKAFAYAGFAIAFISAVIAHLCSGDPLIVVLKAIVMLLLLLVSLIYFQKTRHREPASSW